MIDEDLNTPKNIGKGLLMCAFLASASMGMQQVQASGTDLSTPTLDALHNAGTTMPDSTDIYPESGYTLTETTDKTLDNVITKYEVKPVTRYYDMTTGTEVAPEARVAGTTYKEIQEKDLVPHYYQVNLKQTEYGAGVNSTTTTLTTQPVKDVEITSKYDTSQTRFDNTTDNSATNYSGDYINQTSTTVNIYQIDKLNKYNFVSGAINNYSTSAKLGDITGNFIKNHATTSSGYRAYGGAIDNYQGTITDIKSNFIGNYATTSDYAEGGAIQNSKYGKIDSITGNFIGNYASGYVSYGGAIDNCFNSTIGNITGNFIGNYLSNRLYAEGGAIYNYAGANINNITGDFIGNYTYSQLDRARSGAIGNESANIGNITGDFIGNYANAVGTNSSSAYATGGAIYNWNGTIGGITGDFIRNYASSIYSNATGGAIYNNKTIGNISGNFIENYADSTYSFAVGGGIYNWGGSIGNISGNFIGNYTKSNSDISRGSVLWNGGNIDFIKGNFIANNSISNSNNANSFVSGGAIYNRVGSDIKNIEGSFIGNFAKADNVDSYGGAIENNNGKFGNIKANFIKNSAIGANATGGAITNRNSGEITNITGDFIGNYAKSTSGVAKGGAISNDNGTIGDITGDFIGNYAKSTSGVAKGGAIYTNKDLNFVANNRQSVFSGNYTESAGVKDDNAIYVDSNSAKLSFKLKNNGSFVMKDNIDGTTGYDVDIQGDDINNTNFYLQNDIKNADVSIGNTTLNLINNQIYANSFNTFTLTSDTNIKVDVDLANSSMDRITANTYGTHNGNVIVNGMNLLSDMHQGTNQEIILFADKGLKDNVISRINGLPSSTQKTLYTPIFKYTATYDNREDAGYYTFTRGSLNMDNPSNLYNPAVLAAPVATQFGGYITQLYTYDEAFSNMDITMLMTRDERTSMKYRNKYAMEGIGNNLGTFSPNQIPEQNAGIWFRPYATFENVGLHNGPKVGNVMYGSLIGGDSPLIELKNGWEMIYSAYAGYNGSHQNYDGVSIYQNGGTLGASSVFYKGNFFTGLTADVGASVAEASTMYGHDDITMLMTGIASKTGYNWELAKGRFVIQPNYLMSYTFVNTFDYTNSAGVRINSDPLNAVQIVPGIKFIGNLKNAWQPYASVQMVWNIMDDTKVKANNVNLPELSVRPYIQYGIGVQKRWGDRFTGFIQTMFRNGGRSGISIQLGSRFMVGKNPKTNKKSN